MVRLKHRYLLVNFLYPAGIASKIKVDDNILPDIVQFRQPSPTSLTKDLLYRLIKDGVEELFGDYGHGKIAGSLKIMYLSTATSTAIVRVARDHHRLVWAALTFTTELPKPAQTPCVIQVLRNSGTVRKSEEAAIRFAKDLILKARRNASEGGGLGPVVPSAEEALSIEDAEDSSDGDDDDDGNDKMSGVE